jgi:hypothetical protein
MTRKIGRPFLKSWPVVLAFSLVGGLALASVPDSNGVIHGDGQ